MLTFQDGWTPLHIAVQSRNRDIAKILLVNGADKSRRNKVGLTRYRAGISSRDEARIFLLRFLFFPFFCKSDLNKVAPYFQDGRTPLDLGLCYGKDFKSYDLTKLLKIVPMDREF